MSKKIFTILPLSFLMIGHMNKVQAQIANCNGFLKGKYLEAGINWNGAIGSSARPPIGFHSHNTASLYNTSACGGAIVTDSSIGFVADPSKDGWSTGSPAYFGDYVLPGNPREGWSYMVDGVQVDVWNSKALTQDSIGSGMSSSVLAYQNAAGVSLIKTQAVKDGMYITHFFTLDTNKLFINVEVELENTSLTTMTNVYYMRTINPHNDQYYSSVADTKNKIIRALPDSLNRSAIATWGTVNTEAYLALATQDNRAKGFIYKNTGLPTGTTIDNIYSGDANYMYNANDSNVANTSIGLIYDLGNFISGYKTHFSYIYAFHTSAIDSDEFTNPHINVTEVKLQDIKLFPNPATSKLVVDGASLGDQMSITDICGREVYSANIDKVNSTFDITVLQPGLYLALLRSDRGEIKKRDRLVIQ